MPVGPASGSCELVSGLIELLLRWRVFFGRNGFTRIYTSRNRAWPSIDETVITRPISKGSVYSVCVHRLHTVIAIATHSEFGNLAHSWRINTNSVVLRGYPIKRMANLSATAAHIRPSPNLVEHAVGPIGTTARHLARYIKRRWWMCHILHPPTNGSDQYIPK